MDYLETYIPKEYLALKINYCKKQLEQLPKVKLCEYHTSGETIKRIVVGKHRYNLDSSNGKKYYAIWLEKKKREKLKQPSVAAQLEMLLPLILLEVLLKIFGHMVVEEMTQIVIQEFQNDMVKK